jgi:protein gp37
MSKNSKIEWTDHTFNPWIGCTKVSPACDHCYAEVSTPARTFPVNWGAGQPRRLTGEANWKEPLRWNANHEQFFAEHGRRQRVFCASLADVFDNEVPMLWRQHLMTLIADTPNLDWLLLTKRIGNAERMLEAACLHNGRLMDASDRYRPLPNVWIGATICNQEEANRDIPKLLQVPAAVRFLSMEPLLGPVDLSIPLGLKLGWDKADKPFWWPNHRPQIDWIIVGGESGTQARPMHPDWARAIREQCDKARVPFLFKQWGEWCPRGPESLGYPVVEGVPRFRMTDAGEDGQSLGAVGGNDVWMNRAGKKAAGRLLDGRTHDEIPQVEA